RTASCACSRDGRVTRTSWLARPFGAAVRGKGSAIDIVLSFLPAAATWPARRGTGSVEAQRLLRAARLHRRAGAVERKGGNADEKALAAVRFHFVIADHETGRGRQRAA